MTSLTIKTSLRRFACGLTLCILFGGAQAQRTPVPLVDFKDIPIQSAKPMTREDVRAAIVAAATELGWDAVPKADGTVFVMAVKNDKHFVKVKLSYEATSFSVTYVHSLDMKYIDRMPFADEAAESAGRSTRFKDAAAEQASRFAKQPETPYAVKTVALIHPYYETWVRELVVGIRRQLKAG